MENSDDRAAKEAEELLPCLCQNMRESRHHPNNTYCPAYNRPAVAAKLRKAYAESEQLKNDEVRHTEYEQELSNELDKKAAEIARLRTELGQAQADLMGCRDGALVRDLRADLRQVIHSSRTHVNKLQDEIVLLRAELAKEKA